MTSTNMTPDSEIYNTVQNMWFASPRNVQHERQVTMLSKVYLQLLSSLPSSNRHRWFGQGKTVHHGSGRYMLVKAAGNIYGLVIKTITVAVSYNPETVQCCLCPGTVFLMTGQKPYPLLQGGNPNIPPLVWLYYLKATNGNGDLESVINALSNDFGLGSSSAESFVSENSWLKCLPPTSVDHYNTNFLRAASVLEVNIREPQLEHEIKSMLEDEEKEGEEKPGLNLQKVQGSLPLDYHTIRCPASDSSLLGVLRTAYVFRDMAGRPIANLHSYDSSGGNVVVPVSVWGAGSDRI